MLVEHELNNLASKDRWARLGSHLSQFQLEIHWASYLTLLILNFLVVNKQNISTFFRTNASIKQENLSKVLNILLFYYYERHNKGDLKCHRKKTMIIINVERFKKQPLSWGIGFVIPDRGWDLEEGKSAAKIAFTGSVEFL